MAWSTPSLALDKCVCSFAGAAKAKGGEYYSPLILRLTLCGHTRFMLCARLLRFSLPTANDMLGLADCSARDYTSQLAHISLVMIGYNLLASLKRSLDYETIGGLFKISICGCLRFNSCRENMGDNHRGSGCRCRAYSG